MGSRSFEGEDARATLPGVSVDADAAVRDVAGTRAGAVVFAGIVALNGGNSLFHLVAARYLGPADYSELVSLLALSGLIALPLGAIQLAVARAVARDAAVGLAADVTARARQSVLLSLGIAVLLTILVLAATPLIEKVLEIDATLSVALTAVLTIPSLLAPALWGVAQGLQRFSLISGTATLGAALRVALLAAVIPLGLTVEGALAATVAASSVAALATVVILGPVLRAPTNARHSHAAFARDAVPVAVATLAITSLTTVDLLVAKAALSSTEAGVYGSASLLGRLILYVPSTIAIVLLPKVTYRAAAARATHDILRASLLVTAVISLLATAVLAAAPKLVLNLTFGADFASAAPLLWLFGVAMTQFALLNIVLIHDLGHHSTTVARLLIAGAVLELAGYALFHDSGRQLLYVAVATGSLLLAACAAGTLRSGSRR